MWLNLTKPHKALLVDRGYGNLWPDLWKGSFTHIHLPTLTIRNFRLIKAIDLKFGQEEAPT